MDDELGAIDELQELLGDLGKARLAGELVERDAVHGRGAGVDLALGIQVFVEVPAGGAAVHHLDAADLDDAMAALGLEAGGFGVEYDLSQAAILIRRSLPQASRRSPRWRADPRARCPRCRSAPSPTAT